MLYTLSRMKIYLLASVLMLCSCGVAKAPLKPQLVYPVKTIEIAEIEGFDEELGGFWDGDDGE